MRRHAAPCGRLHTWGLLDKLGVTGSSPVPPTFKSPANAGLFPQGGGEFDDADACLRL